MKKIVPFIQMEKLKTKLENKYERKNMKGSTVLKVSVINSIDIEMMLDCLFSKNDKSPNGKSQNDFTIKVIKEYIRKNKS